MLGSLLRGAVLLSALAACLARGEPSGSPSATAPDSETGMSEPLVFEGCPEHPGTLLGRLVTVVGTQTRAKQPTVCDFDVDGIAEHSGRQVRVTGVVGRSVIAPQSPGAEFAASRGPGVYWILSRSGGTGLSRPTPIGHGDRSPIEEK
jgi:hypothetical protein